MYIYRAHILLRIVSKTVNKIIKAKSVVANFGLNIDTAMTSLPVILGFECMSLHYLTKWFNSLTFRSVREGDGNLPDLLKEIKSRTGTTKTIDAARCEFMITLIEVKANNEMEEEWRKEGTSKYEMKEGRKEQMSFTLEILHLEFPFPYIESALHKYVKNPKTERTTTEVQS